MLVAEETLESGQKHKATLESGQKHKATFESGALRRGHSTCLTPYSRYRTVPSPTTADLPEPSSKNVQVDGEIGIH